MFAYPLNDPGSVPLTSRGDSWLVRQWSACGSFHSISLKPTRLVVSDERAAKLKAELEERFHLTAATVYVDLERLTIR
jgi:hypothetical protein